MGLVWKPLIQLLDRFLHYGPHLVWDPFDPKPLVDLLTVHVSRGEEQHVEDDVDDEYAPSDRNMRRVFRTLWSEISLFAEPGALHGKVSRINVCWGDLTSRRVVPDKELSQEKWKYLKNYGFHWGIETRLLLRLSHA